MEDDFALTAMLDLLVTAGSGVESKGLPMLRLLLLLPPPTGISSKLDEGTFGRNKVTLTVIT